jgi:hypothetical protein
VLLVVGAVGIALLAVGVTTAAGWKLIVPGFLALLVALPGDWLIQRRRHGRSASRCRVDPSAGVSPRRPAASRWTLSAVGCEIDAAASEPCAFVLLPRGGAVGAREVHCEHAVPGIVSARAHCPARFGSAPSSLPAPLSGV